MQNTDGGIEKPATSARNGHQWPSLDWASLAVQAMDSLPSRIAIVDVDGTIVAVNRAWRNFAHLNGAADADACEGRNVFAVCAAEPGDGLTDSARLVVGLRQVLAGELPIYEADEPCPVRNGMSWIGVRVSPLSYGGRVMAVLAYDDITSRKEAELALRETQEAHDRAQAISSSGSWRADFITQTFTPSSEGSRLLGWSPGAHTFAELFSLVHPDDRQLQVETWMHALRERTRFDLVHRMILKGEERWVRVMAEFVFDSSGMATTAFGVTQDITEAHNAEVALRDAELALERAQAIARVGGWTVDFATGMYVPSPQAASLGHWAQGPQPFARLIDLVHPDDRDRHGRQWAEAQRSGRFDLEHRMLTTSGHIWVRVQAELVFDAEGRPRRAFGVTQDITERRRMHDAIAEERVRLRTVLDTLPDAVCMKDAAGTYVAYNAAFAQMMRISETQALGQTDGTVFPTHLADAFKADDERAIRAGSAIRYEESIPAAISGRDLVLETIKTPVYGQGQLIGVLGISRDVSVQRRMVEALAASEHQKEFALDAGQFGTWYHAGESRDIVLDARARQLWDVDLDTIDSITLIESRVHPEDRARILAVPRRSGRYSLEFRVRHRDGSEHWLLSYTRILAESASDAYEPSSHGTVQDVTERKRAEEMVARFVSASPAVIYALEIAPSGAFPVRWFSGNLTAMTGWTDTEAREPGWWADNVHPDDRGALLHVNPGSLDRFESIQEFRFRRSDGQYIWVRDEKRLLTDGEGRPAEVVGSWSDITQRVELENQLRQAHKLEAIGLLAGGIAHDFNNLLTVIGGNSDLLKPHVSTTDGSRLLTEIREAGTRAGALTRQLLAFSRSQVLAPRVAPINDLVRRAEVMLTRLIGEDIRCDYELGDAAGHVRVDAGQFEQVILNLAVNARDAMPRGGRLTVRTRSVAMDDDFARRHPDVPTGTYAEVSVADTGSGMSPEVLARIFEPFFTTKEPGRGTGLGLSMAFGIVKQSGGHLEVRSRVGEGTTFIILLPQVEPSTAPQPEARGEVVTRQGHETILLVEDEASVRKLARLALERSGYRVLVAENGLMALDLAKQHREPIDMLVTDVVMPEMRGPDLAHLLSERRPGLRVLFMSGYVQDALDRADMSEANFLLKPFTLKELSDRVRGILDDGV